MVPWTGPAASTAVLPPYRGWTPPAASAAYEPTAPFTTAGIGMRVMQHGLLAPGHQTEADLQTITAMIDGARDGFSSKSALAAFTTDLTESLRS